MTVKKLNLKIGNKIIHLKINPAPEVKKDEIIKTGYVVPSAMPAQAIPIGSVPQEKINNDFQIQIDSGISLPKIKKSIKSINKEIDNEDLSALNIKYPLIPAKPKKGEKVYAYSHIYYDKKKNEMIYNLVEPKITEDQKKILEEIKEFIQEKIDINFSQLRKNDARNYITKIFNISMEYFKSRINEKYEDTLKYYIFRDFIGLGKLEPFLNDQYIEDISCDGSNINIYIYHRNPKIGSLVSNVKFDTKEELDYFTNKLAERCGKVISIANPLLDGTLPDGSRVQATLGSDIARRGSNFTIRMFPEKPMTAMDLVEYGTLDSRMLAYYWMLIEHGSSLLISGGTATGKTSLLNVLSFFIKPQMKIVSIEDTAELRLPHSHWVPEIARTAISEEGKHNVDMFELLRESLRQRPDYIIVGEVRGKEAFVLFQQIATGHSGLSTIHAENFPKLIDRLTSPPINLPPNLIQNLDAVLFVKRLKMGKKYIRRVVSTVEVIGFDRDKNVPIINEVFKWDPKTDTFKDINKSVILRKITDLTDMNEKDVHNEIRKRAKVIDYLIVRKIRDYKQIGYIFNLFYTSPDYLFEKIDDVV